LARASLGADRGGNLKGSAQTHERSESTYVIKVIMQTPFDKQTK